MADPTPRPEGEYFHSFDCEDFWLDKPGDTTVRPCRPSMLKFMTELRARHLQAEAARTEKPASNGRDS